MDNTITLDAQGRIALALGQALLSIEVMKDQLAAMQKQADEAKRASEGAPPA